MILQCGEKKREMPLTSAWMERLCLEYMEKPIPLCNKRYKSTTWKKIRILQCQTETLFEEESTG
ncbi:unnamed protein product [Caretta caretta]